MKANEQHNEPSEHKAQGKEPDTIGHVLCDSIAWKRQTQRGRRWVVARGARKEEGRMSAHGVGFPLGGGGRKDLGPGERWWLHNLINARHATESFT